MSSKDSNDLTLITNVRVRLIRPFGDLLMVMEISYLGRKRYLCEICASGYVDQVTAVECEGYCRTHKTNSPVITKRAVLKPE